MIEAVFTCLVIVECQASEMADIYPSFDIVYLLPYFLETSAPGAPCTWAWNISGTGKSI